MEIDPEIKKILENSFSTSSFIHLFFSGIGLIYYFVMSFLFKYYYKCPSLIKNEIFSFILLYSLKALYEFILISPTTNYMTSFFIEIYSFYLLLSYINKCLTSNQISDNSNDYKLTYKTHICLIYFLASFPLEKIYNLSEKFIVYKNIAKMMIFIFIFGHINNKIKLLLDYLKRKNKINSKYQKKKSLNEFSYYKTIRTVYYLFFAGFILIITSYFLTQFLQIRLKLESLSYIAIVCFKFGIIFITIGCLFICYSLNKEYTETHMSKTNSINIEIQQKENEDNIDLVSGKKEETINETNINKDKDSNLKIEGEESKDSHLKINEETESLNK